MLLLVLGFRHRHLELQACILCQPSQWQLRCLLTMLGLGMVIIIYLYVINNNVIYKFNVTTLLPRIRLTQTKEVIYMISVEFRDLSYQLAYDIFESGLSKKEKFTFVEGNLTITNLAPCLIT